MISQLKNFDVAFESLEGVAKLRQVILDLTFRGKLKISNKSAPIDSGIFSGRDLNVTEIAVPSHWKVLSLPECYKVIGKKHNQLQTSEYKAKGAYPIIDQGKSKIAGYSDKTEAVLKIPHPVIVFGDHTRLIKYIDFDFIIGADGVKVLKPEKFIDPRYFYYFLKSLKIRERGYARHFSVLNEHFIPFPDLSEQQEMVRILDTFMTLCDSLESMLGQKSQTLLLAHSASIKRLIESDNADDFASSWEFICNHFDVFYSTKENVEELKKAILTLAMKGKLVPQDNYNQESYTAKNNVQIGMSKRIQKGTNRSDKADNYAHDLNIPYNIPSSWQWNRLQDICFNWGQKKPVDKFTYIDVSSIDNTKGRVGNSVKVIEASEAPSRARKLVKKGSVIFSTVRPYLLNIAIVNEDYTPEPIASTAFAVLHPIEGISNRYLYWYLQAPVFLKYLDESMKGVAYPAISESDFFKGLIPIPPFNEQEQIADKIEHLVNICNNLTDKLEEAALKQTKVLESIVKQVTAS